MESLFSMEGRLNRARYFWRSMAISLACWVVAFAVGFALGMTMGRSAQPVAGVVGFVIGIGGAVVVAFQAVRRLHDLGRPGTHYWLLLVPFYNIYLALLLLFKKGTEGPNQYGADPLGAAAPVVPANT